MLVDDNVVIWVYVVVDDVVMVYCWVGVDEIEVVGYEERVVYEGMLRFVDCFKM